MTQKFSKAWLRSPFWLKGKEIDVIDQQLFSNEHIGRLDTQQQKKVTALLYSITYAEKWALRRNSWLRRLLIRWITPPSPLGQRKVNQIFIKQTETLPGLIDHLVREVNLEKTVPSILAEFHEIKVPKVPFQKRGFFFWIRSFFKPPRLGDHSSYISDGLEAYHYVLKD